MPMFVIRVMSAAASRNFRKPLSLTFPDVFWYRPAQAKWLLAASATCTLRWPHLHALDAAFAAMPAGHGISGHCATWVSFFRELLLLLFAGLADCKPIQDPRSLIDLSHTSNREDTIRSHQGHPRQALRPWILKAYRAEWTQKYRESVECEAGKVTVRAWLWQQADRGNLPVGGKSSVIGCSRRHHFNQLFSLAPFHLHLSCLRL